MDETSDYFGTSVINNEPPTVKDPTVFSRDEQ